METRTEAKKSARCPNCGSFSYRRVADLEADDRIIFDRLPASAYYAKKEREQHLYCPRCGHGSSERQSSAA